MFPASAESARQIQTTERLLVIGTSGQEGLASLLTLCAGSVRATWGLVVVGAVTGLYRLVGQLLIHVWVCTADGSQIAEGLWSPNGEWYI